MMAKLLKRWWYSHRFSIIKALMFAGSAWIILEFAKWTTPDISNFQLAIFVIAVLFPINVIILMWEPEKEYCEYCGQRKSTNLINTLEIKKILRLCKDCELKAKIEKIKEG